MAKAQGAQQRTTAVLRELHELAGEPSVRALSHTTLSATTVHNVLHGNGQPRRGTVAEFISACLKYAKKNPNSAQLTSEQKSLAYWLRRYDDARSSSKPSRTDRQTGDVNLHTGTSVRTHYRLYMQRYMPQQLRGREPEVSKLAEFCRSAGTAGQYLWLRAPAWSGKTALLAQLVSDPPSGVRVVSFFVTARWAGQDNRVAFVDNVVEQLTTILGKEAPSALTDSTRDAYLLALLTEAAEACAIRGEQFVLVVDGLDEDRGVTVGPDAHSIAALLPGLLPAGMRVVVAGRPEPPIPADVSRLHPLRDPDIVWPLAPSPHAQAVRVDAVRELKTLLSGESAGQDLLALLTASGGGLTSEDLSELTGRSMWEIEDHLQSVTGRTFTCGPSPYSNRSTPEVFVLAHDELRVTAQEVLGPRRLATYRRRIHTWAEQYRIARWPVSTPEYLLFTYHHMLAATDDLPRMVTFATDPARQDRMHHVAGNDSIAITEITTALDAFLTHQPLNLAAMVQLAIHRDYLLDRTESIPTELPAVWVALGHPNRAEDLANSMPWREERAVALAGVAEALFDTGDSDRADQIIDDAESLVYENFDADSPRWDSVAVAETLAKFGEPDRALGLAELTGVQGRCRVLAAAAEAQAKAGAHDQAAETINDAEALTRTITDVHLRDRALLSIAGTFARLGELDRAGAVVDSISDLVERVRATAAVAQAVIQTGLLDRAAGLIDNAEALARSLTEPSDRERALPAVARAMLAAGQLERATDVIHHVDVEDQSTAPSGEPSTVELVAALAELGQFERAEVLAPTFPLPEEESSAWVMIAEAAIVAGEIERATEAIAQAESAAYSLPETYSRDIALTSAVELLAKNGQQHLAQPLADFLEDPTGRIEAQEFIAEVRVKAGDLDQAVALARSWNNGLDQDPILVSIVAALATVGKFDQAANLTRSIDDSHKQARALTHIAEQLAKLGEFDRSEDVARSINEPAEQTRALTLIADSLVKNNQLARATKLIDKAEELARSIRVPQYLNWPLESVIDAFARLGKYDRALTLTHALDNPRREVQALSSVAEAMAEASEFDQAEAVAAAITDASDQLATRVSIAAGLFHAGEEARALAAIRDIETTAHAIQHSDKRGTALAALTDSLVRVGELDRAATIARSIDDLTKQSRAWSFITSAMVNCGESDRARALAHSLSHPTVRSAALMPLALHGDERQAESAIAEILTLTDWHVPLDAVVKIKPEALPVIVDALTAVARSA